MKWGLEGGKRDSGGENRDIDMDIVFLVNGAGAGAGWLGWVWLSSAFQVTKHVQMKMRLL